MIDMPFYSQKTIPWGEFSLARNQQYLVNELGFRQRNLEYLSVVQTLGSAILPKSSIIFAIEKVLNH